MLTYFTATRTIDYVIEGWEAYTGVTIISSKSEEIKHKLVNEMRREINRIKESEVFYLTVSNRVMIAILFLHYTKDLK